MFSERILYVFIIQLFFCTFLLANTGNAQRKSIEEVKITLTSTERSVKEIFNLIENKTNFKFTYNDNMIDFDQSVKVVERNKTVYKVLEEITKQTRLSFVQVNENIHVKSQSGPDQSDNVGIQAAQKVTVKGTVNDENGEGLPGAVVSAEGSTNGTVTDLDGNFSIELEEGDVLVVSFIGYKTQRINILNQSQITVSMELDASSLDEFVVIGYGVVRRSDLTGAVSSITSKELGDRQATSVANLIQGRAPGVDVSGGSIRIRGVTTINNTDPLIVIDGFLGADLNTVNPNDIENIEVLKDASATAIYGARGANGVILITTKSGSIGALKVDVNVFSGIQSAANRLEVMNANQYIDYVQDALRNANQRIPDKLLSNDVRVDRNNWQDLVFKTGRTSEANISLSGGTEKSTYYFGISHRTEEDFRIGPSSRATFIRAKNTYKIKPWFSFSPNVSIGYRTNEGQAPPMLQTLGYLPYKEIFDENIIGGFSDIDRINDASDISNPLAPPNKVFPKTDRLTYLGQLNLEIKPFEGFTYTIQAGIQGDFSRFFLWQDEYVGGTNLNVNTMNESSSYFYSPIVENFINYTKQFGDHNVSALLGNTWQNGIQSGGIGIGATGYSTNEIKQISVAENLLQPTQNIFIDSRLSYFGRINYSYKSKYLLTFNMRADGSPRFSPNNRWGQFPSLAAAWRLDQESFLMGNEVFSQLKLRAGWGRSGNDAIGQFRFLPNIFAQGVGYPLGTNQQLQSGATVVQNVAPNIKWETTESLTFGVDFGLFNDALTGTVEYFEKGTNDILFSVPSPLSMGFGAGFGGGAIIGDAIVNAASVSNKGLEFLLTNRGNIGKNINYSISANYTYQDNQVTGLGLGQPFLAVVSRTEVGFPIGYFFGNVADGIFMNQAEVDAANALAQEKGHRHFQEASTSAGDVRFKDLNGDGKIDGDDRTKIGNPIPKHLFGLNFSLNFGQFDFNMFWQGIADVDIYDANYRWTRGGVRILNQETNVLNRWKSESEPGNGIQPRALSGDGVANTRPSSLMVQDASYFRLRLMSVGYSFQDELITRIGLSRLRIYASGENLITLTKFDGFNPEIGGGNLQRGINNFAPPAPRTFVFGISIGL
jgi:TonB-linked SusC/RagA family outer membrane protein